MLRYRRPDPQVTARYPALRGGMRFQLPRVATAPVCPSEVRGTVAVPPGLPGWRRLLRSAGPGLLVAVGYMDPGNWATDIESGSRYGYDRSPAGSQAAPPPRSQRVPGSRGHYDHHALARGDETNFFHWAGVDDTKVALARRPDRADVAKDGWNAPKAGQDNKVSGTMNKVQVAAAGVLPQSVGAQRHRNMAEPGSGGIERR